jgi:cell division protein FtsI (penicillin-binding protein 3)
VSAPTKTRPPRRFDLQHTSPFPSVTAGVVRLQPRRQPVSRRRLVAFLLCLTLAFGLITARLAFVQGFSAHRYESFGVSQRLRTITLPGERGSIFDRNRAELAISIPQKTVFADPRLVRDPAGSARSLSPILGVDEEFLRARLGAAAAFVYLARKVDDKVANQVKALRLPGIGFIEEPKRFDPAQNLALPLLGQVGTDNQGLSGLEQQYERQLTGQPGQLLVERDPTGHSIAAGVRRLRPSKRGGDLVLTIDRSLQYETERSLTEEVRSSNAKGGIAIVMEPSTGEVLAMANLKREGDAIVPAPNNAAVMNVYEPGSVNKVITVAGAIEEGLVSPTSSLVVADHMPVAGYEFKDHDPHPTRPWTVTDIIANSSNIGTIMIGQRLGKTRIDHYMRAFGLGSHTGLKFPGESAGILLDLSEWTGPSIATVPIGQGIAVTGLQMLEAFNTIANGGVHVAPKLVLGSLDRSGRLDETPASPRERVVSESTAKQVTGMLTEVVRVGTAKAAAVEGYRAAGKTGTARKPLEGARGYKEGAYIATFAGFVPAESPRLSAIVILDEPYPIYGGLVSAPVFAQVARYGLRLFRVPPPTAAAVASVPTARAEAVRADNDASAPARPPVTTTTVPPTTTTTLGGVRNPSP